MPPAESGPEFSPAPGLQGIHFLQGRHVGGYANSYFVERDAGNVLVSPILYRPRLADWMEGHGGLDLIFVTHHDEIRGSVLGGVGRSTLGPPPTRIPACQYRERLGAKIALHDLDAEHLTECAVDLRWTEDFRPARDIHLIHTPGHTPGSACLLLTHLGRGILFCGDNLVLDVAGAIDGDVDHEDLALVRRVWEKMLEHPFDVLVPLHTGRPDPRPYLPRGRAALREALLHLVES